MILALNVAGCSQVPDNLGGSSIFGELGAWLDAPLDNTRLYFPAQYTLVCHGTDPGGVKALEFSANGLLVSMLDNPDPRQTLFSASTVWQPGLPGEYIIRCRAQNRADEWSAFASATVIVVEVTPTIIQTITPTSSLTPTTTPTFTPTPTITPSHTSTPVSGSITFTSQVSTNEFQYQRDCLPNPGQVTIIAKLSNTTNVFEVYIFFHLENSELGVNTSWNNGLPMLLVGNGEFSRTISWKDIPDLSQIYNHSATFVYQFVAVVGATNNFVRSKTFYDVKLSPCH